MKFTKRQLKNWEKYEEIRLSGKWNMYGVPNSVIEWHGMTEDEFIFCMEYYSELEEAYKKGLS